MDLRPVSLSYLYPTTHMGSVVSLSGLVRKPVTHQLNGLWRIQNTVRNAVLAA